MKKIIILALCIISLTATAKEKKLRTHKMKKTAPTEWVDNWYQYYQNRAK